MLNNSTRSSSKINCWWYYQEIQRKWYCRTWKKSRPPQKTSEHSQRVLIRMFRANALLNATQLKTNSSDGHLLTTRAVRGILLKRGLGARVARRKPLLSNHQRLRRLRFHRLHHKNTLQQWSKVCFSTEAKFELFPARRVFVRRPKGTQFANQARYTKKSLKFGGASIMVWAFISYSGIRNFIKVDGSVNSPVYSWTTMGTCRV